MRLSSSVTGVPPVHLKMRTWTYRDLRLQEIAGHQQGLDRLPGVAPVGRDRLVGRRFWLGGRGQAGLGQGGHDPMFSFCSR